MASNVLNPITEDSPTGIQHRPKHFADIVAECKDQLPLAVEVTSGGRYSGIKDGENNHVQLHKGDILWVTKADVESVTVSIESPRKKDNLFVIPPDWSGKFRLPPTEEFPTGHIFTSVSELSKDFPVFVTVREEIKIDKVTVKEGNRLKLVRQTTTATGGKFLLCDVLETGENVLLPADMEGKFEKTENDITFTVKDLAERFPLHVEVQVSPSSDTSDENSKADTQRIPGVPEDYDSNYLLNHFSYTEAALWETSNQEGSSILKIPSGTKMEAVGLEKWEEDQSPAMDIMELAKSAKKDKPVYAIPAEDSGEVLEDLGITQDATLILHPVETVERVLIQGSTSPLLVNKQYRGHFKPQTEYGTGQDLVNLGIHRELKVTQSYQPKDDETGLATLYVNDMVKLHLSKAKMFSTDEDTEVLVVELERTASKSGVKPGVIYVPANALVNYQERVQYSVDQKLAQLAQSQVPLSVSFSSPPNRTSGPPDSAGADEDILQQESPMMVLGLHKYLAVMATVLNKESPKDSTTIEISEHRQLKVRRVRRPPASALPEQMHSDKSDSAVKKVSQKYFDVMNQTFQQRIAAKNVRRRKTKSGGKDNESKRKSWVQRNLSFKAIQKRLSRPPDETRENGQKTEEWTM